MSPIGRAAWFAVALISGVAVPRSGRAEVTVGVVLSLTGIGESTGILFKNALAFAPPEIGGQKIRYIVVDSGSDSTRAANAARSLITQNKVDILLGDTMSPGATAMAAVAAEFKTLQISEPPLSVDPATASWTVQIAPPADLWMSKILEHMRTRSVKTVGYIGFSDTWGDQCYASLLKQARQQGIKVTSDERFARLDQNVTAQIDHVLLARSDAVFVGTSTVVGIRPILALRARGYRGLVYGTPGVLVPQIITVGGSALEGTILPAGPGAFAEQLSMSNPNKAAGLKFIAAYEEVYGKGSANTPAGNGIDLLHVFADIVARALGTGAQPGTPSFRKLIRETAFATHDLVGVNGIYSYSPGRLSGLDSRAIVLLQLSAGRWNVLR